MKTNHILATGLIAGGLFFSTPKAQELTEVPFSTPKAQELTEVPIDSSLAQEQLVEDTSSDSLPVKYTGQDSVYDATPIRQTEVRGLTEKQFKKLNKKYPDGISVNPTAFDMTIEDSLDVLDVIDRALAYTIEFDSLNAEEKDFINYEAYRIRKNIADAVNSYNEMVKDGKLTTEEISNLLQPKYALPTADLNRLKEALPKDSYDLILSAQENFNNYVGRITNTTQASVEQALKTAWYNQLGWDANIKDPWSWVKKGLWGTATYAAIKAFSGEEPAKEKVYNTGDWSNNTY